MEGYSDLHFLAEVLEKVGRTGVFIKPFNGNADLAEKLQVFLTPELLMEKTAIGLMVVPDAQTKGELETLVWRSLTADAANSGPVACIEAFEKCLAQTGIHAKSIDKARIGALLSFKNDEDPRLGPGARAKAFDLSRPELQDLGQFLAGFPCTIRLGATPESSGPAPPGGP